MNRRAINISHIAFVAPLLAFVAYCGLEGKPLPRWFWMALLALAVIVAAYHAYRLLNV